MRYLIVPALASLLALAGCNSGLVTQDNITALQAKMVELCQFLPQFDTAAALIKSVNADAGTGADIVNMLAKKGCAVVTAKGADTWVLNGVTIKGEFVKPGTQLPPKDESPFPPGFGAPKQ